MRRGGAGAILNSKSKFDRCRIPRLVLDDKEDSEEEVRRKEEQRLLEDKEAEEEQAEIWSTTRYNERRKDDLRAQDDIPDVLEEGVKTMVSDTAPDTRSSTSTETR